MGKVHLVNVPGADIGLSAFNLGQEIRASQVGSDMNGPLSPSLSPSEGEREVAELMLPKVCLFVGPLLTPRAIHIQAGGYNPRFGKAMIEYHKAIIEADVAIGKFQIVYRTAW